MIDARPLDAREIREMSPVLLRAFTATSEAERDAALDLGIVTWGPQFFALLDHVARRRPLFEPVAVRGVQRILHWLGGATVTGRADEDERRALLALEMTKAPGLGLKALLRLEPDHPLRRAKLASARQAVYHELDEARRSGRPVDEVLSLLTTLLDADDDHAGREALLAEGLAVLDAHPDEPAEKFRLAAAAVLIDRAIDASSTGNRAIRNDLATRGRRLLAPVLTRADDPTTAAYLCIDGMLSELDGDSETAFGRYGSVLSTQPTEEQRAAALGGALRTGVRIGRYQDVVDRGSAGLDVLVRRYVSAVNGTTIKRRGEQLGKAVSCLSEAYVAVGDLRGLLTTLERSSNLRLRHRAALRHRFGGRRVLRLEAALWAVRRGLPVGPLVAPSAAEGRASRLVHVQTRLEEAYRRAAQNLTDRFDAPEPDRVARSLRADEGVVVLATDTWGTAVLCMRRNDPFRGEIRPDAVDAWAKTLMPTPEPAGWGYAVGMPWVYQGDPRSDLDTVLARADRIVGRCLADWANQHHIRRLWIVPYGFLAMVPWWAVPALRTLDVRTSPGLHLLPKRHGIASLRGRAVVVSDPTNDLPLARAEAVRVRTHLNDAGIAVEDLTTEQATEDAIGAALVGARILHFCGHAMSDMLDESNSALYVCPASGLAGSAGEALLDRLAAGAKWRSRPDGCTEADVEVDTAGPPHAARLIEQRLSNGTVLRQLEHGPTGTLLAHYVDGHLVRLTELWSTGDLAVSGALRGVRLAVLSACQSGGGVVGDLHEFAGLPAALMLAGVRTVISTAWQIDDALAALTADLLWQELSRDRHGTVDIAATVDRLRRQLARMPRDEAARRFNLLRSTAPTPRARFMLEARCAAVRAGPPYPFSHPFDWAPLFVSGEPLTSWRTR